MPVIPTVSVLCMTFGRPTLLQEVVESFRRQTFTDAELVILNDNPYQRLVCGGVPNVHVVNATRRYPTVEAKRATLVERTKGRYLQFWDDDDIHLPHQLQAHIDQLALTRGGGGSKLMRCWLDTGGPTYALASGTGLHTTLFHRAAIDAIGGWSTSADVFKALLSRRLLISPPAWDKKLPPFIRRTQLPGILHSHTAVGPDEIAKQERHWKTAAAPADQRTGTIALVPGWQRDYHAIADASFRALAGTV